MDMDGRTAVGSGDLFIVNFAQPVVGGNRAAVAEDEPAHRIGDGGVFFDTPVVDMGGFSSLVALYMDEMQALQTGKRNIYAGIAAGADFSYAAAVAPQDQYQAAFGSRTVGILAGHYDEFFFNKSAEEKTAEEQKITGTVTYKDFVSTNSGKAFLGFAADGSPVAGQFYKVDSGEVKLDGNAVRATQSGERVVYTPNQTHPCNRSGRRMPSPARSSKTRRRGAAYWNFLRGRWGQRYKFCPAPAPCHYALAH